MHLEIEHTLRYSYSKPIFLEPHVLRLRPRSDETQRLERFRLELSPQPVAQSELLDIEGNVVTKLWFEGLHEELTIRSHSGVTTLRTNPFDFLIEAGYDHFPLGYTSHERHLLTPHLQRYTHDSSSVSSFAGKLRSEAGEALIPFLGLLNQSLNDFEIIHREEGAPWLPEETLSRRQGACRDLGVLFVETCRAVGVGARFVTGYYEISDNPDPDLHAWAEAYLPGAGWRGYDPTQNLAVADQHVPLAASACPELAAVVSGSFRGDAVSTFQGHIRISSPIPSMQQQQS